ncbi:SDR family NAD(P)-dependent oxidoreductase [Salinivibrio sp. YCSC6]|uniref:SDR family NAD(P)-dependent oxidoreductase n=1 Tax=Salinivibrio sp. YCSC6 TaxID=2003370 RepID=UPI000BBB72BA|nr:SDR family NAD(P)-dependent oxidoreductase [Salinivibrio sp. YCSC6]PCE67639.1 hypothetical protein B6G00_04645 [Salinivibrio sp. YCSC6]QCF35461.1 SDR family NAD(P)-dependent oxidoreductase [Salinivibrio sp. YCSC6]
MDVIILTGCTRGLGLAIHQSLTEQPTSKRLIFIGRNIYRINQTSSANYIELDLKELESGALLAKLPSITPSSVTFINNAGIIDPICSVKSMDHVELITAYNINVLAPAKLVSDLLIWARGAEINILNISSGAANHAIEGWASYCSTKAAFKMYLDVLAKEDPSVSVEHVDPGIMDTSMQKKIRASSSMAMPNVGQFIEYKNNHSLKSPEQVAKALIEKYKLIKQ